MFWSLFGIIRYTKYYIWCYACDLLTYDGYYLRSRYLLLQKLQTKIRKVILGLNFVHDHHLYHSILLDVLEYLPKRFLSEEQHGQFLGLCLVNELFYTLCRLHWGTVPVCVAVKFEANTLSTMLFAYNSIELKFKGRTKFPFAPIFAWIS